MPAKGSETLASVRGSEGRSPYTRVDCPERESARQADAHAGCRGGHSFRQNHAQDIAAPRTMRMPISRTRLRVDMVVISACACSTRTVGFNLPIASIRIA